jgi:predicted protein tyrosine phosphatase
MDPMQLPESAHIIISPYQRVADVLSGQRISHVVSILGKSDQLPWPSTGSRKTLRLEFDDTDSDSPTRVAPTREQIQRLIDFAIDWGGTATSNLLLHCRAGSSRSPAGTAITVAAIGRADLVERVLTAKTYHRPNPRMLELADSLLVPCPRLAERARAIQHPDGNSDWAPVAIPLGP